LLGGGAGFRQAGSEVVGKRGVGAEDVADLESSGHQHPVGVADDGVGFALGAVGVGLGQALEAPERLIHFGAARVVGDDGTVLEAHVVADDDANIVELEALRGVNAADLVDRVVVDCPCVCGVEVPGALEFMLGQLNVGVVGVAFVLRRPLPAVAGDDAGAVVDGIALGNGGHELVRVVEDAEVVVEVLDGASVGVKWFRNEPGSREARGLLVRHIAGELAIAVDSQFLYQVLRVASRDSHAEDAVRVWSDLRALDLIAVPLGTETVEAAARVRAQVGCTLYDAFSAGLAELLDAPLYSADARAHGRLLRVRLIEGE